jgi:hypothetical protein
MTPERVEATTILRAVMGSEALGLSLGPSDRDEAGVCVEDLEYTLGIPNTFEQHIYRTAALREGHKDARSQVGDLDLTIFSLRKFLRLCLDGNPTSLMLLFAPCLESGPKHITCDARGHQLQELAPLIVSRQCAGRFLGYMQNQMERLQSRRGQMRVHRPDLVEAHGYDTKYMGHIVRLGMQGVEVLTTGRMALPMAEPARSQVLAIRLGEVPLADALAMADDLKAQIIALKTSSPLRPHPDVRAVRDFAVRTYLETWKSRAPHLAYIHGHPKFIEYTPGS